MSIEAPPRLKDGDELGAILRAADASVSPERLAVSGAAVKAAVARGVPKAGFPLWKIGVPFALLGLIVIGRQLLRGDNHPAATPPVAVASVVNDAAPAAPPDAAVAVPEPAPAAAVPDAAPEPRPHRPRTDEVAPPPATPDAAPATPSELPEQIRLYEEARAAGSRKEFAVGLDRIDELLRRFPATPLRADAELTRAELLTRADRLDDAAFALEQLAADSSHAGRKGELLRALGDVRRQQGDCTRAIDAYHRAVAAGLGKREQAKVDRGLERCTVPK